MCQLKRRKEEGKAQETMLQENEKDSGDRENTFSPQRLPKSSSSIFSYLFLMREKQAANCEFTSNLTDILATVKSCCLLPQGARQVLA